MAAELLERLSMLFKKCGRESEFRAVEDRLFIYFPAQQENRSVTTVPIDSSLERRLLEMLNSEISFETSENSRSIYRISFSPTDETCFGVEFEKLGVPDANSDLIQQSLRFIGDYLDGRGLTQRGAIERDLKSGIYTVEIRY